MTQDQLERLRDGLLDLADPSTGPSDPAALVNDRVRQLRRRRTAGSLAGVAVVTAGVILASQTLAGTPQSEPPVAGFPTPTRTIVMEPKTGKILTENPPRQEQANLPSFPLPQPWLNQMYTKLPDANAFRPHGYYVQTETKLVGRPWGMVSYQAGTTTSESGCLEVIPQGVFDAAACFDRPEPHARVDWRAQTATSGTKPELTELNNSLVYGVTHYGARSVRITLANGTTYQAPATGTPASRSQRFFALVVPAKAPAVKKVEAFDAQGRLAPELLGD